MPNAKTPQPRAAPPAAIGEGRSPTEKVILTGVAVVGGVLVLSLLQQKGGLGGVLSGLGGIFKAPTTAAAAAAAAQRAATAAAAAQVPVPTEPGITFRSGSFGGFVPIPVDKIVSSIWSIFQPSRTEAAQMTAPGPVQAPVAEQYETLPETYLAEDIPLYDSEGVSLWPTEDQFWAGAEYYDEGPIPAEVTEPITGEVAWTEEWGDWSEPFAAEEWMF